jgi:hypothetical protein
MAIGGGRLFDGNPFRFKDDDDADSGSRFAFSRALAGANKLLVALGEKPYRREPTAQLQDQPPS